MQLILATPGRSFSSNYVKSIVDTVAFCLANQIGFYLSNSQAANLFTARTLTIGGSGEFTNPRKVLGGIPYDYILMIDSDMEWKQEDIAKAITLDKDVVTGVYSCGATGKLAIAREDLGNPQGMKFYHMGDAEVEGVEPFAVDYAGLGWVLIKNGVFETLPWPWFRPHLEPHTETWLGEDLCFSIDLRKAGFTIWCDPNIRLGHQKFWTVYPDLSIKEDPVGKATHDA